MKENRYGDLEIKASYVYTKADDQPDRDVMLAKKGFCKNTELYTKVGLLSEQNISGN